jgi:inhibitor of KinA sporulation pathway (predicted exonuclease)
MATTINEPKQIVLIDGTIVNVRPLKISLLRSFMKKFEKIAEVAEDNDKSMNLLMECVQIAMQQYAPELATDLKVLEDNIDLPTVYKIVEEASGVKLSDTSLMGGLTA